MSRCIRERKPQTPEEFWDDFWSASGQKKSTAVIHCIAHKEGVPVEDLMLDMAEREGSKHGLVEVNSWGDYENLVQRAAKEGKKYWVVT